MVIGSFFFFQAEDGIRDLTVTGVQTCALPIWAARRDRSSNTLCNGTNVACACCATRSAAARRWLNSGNQDRKHTSELQSQSNLVCRLLLEKKKKNQDTSYIIEHNKHDIAVTYT